MCIIHQRSTNAAIDEFTMQSIVLLQEIHRRDFQATERALVYPSTRQNANVFDPVASDVLGPRECVAANDARERSQVQMDAPFMAPPTTLLREPAPAVRA